MAFMVICLEILKQIIVFRNVHTFVVHAAWFMVLPLFSIRELMKLLSAQTQFKKQTMLHAISRIHAKYDIHFRPFCFVSFLYSRLFLLFTFKQVSVSSLDTSITKRRFLISYSKLKSITVIISAAMFPEKSIKIDRLSQYMLVVGSWHHALWPTDTRNVFASPQKTWSSQKVKK